MANPRNDECPDYLDPEFEEACLFFTIEGKTDQEAAALLRNVWIFSNAKATEAWDRQCADEAQVLIDNQQLLDQEKKRLWLLCEQEEDQARQDERKKYKNKYTPIPDRPLPPTALLLLSQHTLNKLRKGDYIPLYFFSNKGIQDAKEDTSGDEDLLMLIQTDKGPTF